VWDWPRRGLALAGFGCWVVAPLAWECVRG
jgi:hypothetical protein